MKNKKLVYFILFAISSYIVWFVLYDLVLQPDGRLDAWLTKTIAQFSSILLSSVGYDASYNATLFRGNISINGHHLLGIAHVCNGLVLYALFSGFIISFPGSVTTKLWYIPVGIVSIFFVNVIRAVILCIIKIHSPQNLDFNHRYTFTIIMYSFIFLLWMIWVNKYSFIQNKDKEYETSKV